MRWMTLSLAVLLMGCALDDKKVGAGSVTSTMPTGQLIRDIGQVINFPVRPVDMAVSPNKRFALIKNLNSVWTVDIATWTKVDEQPLPGNSSIHGIAVSGDGRAVYVSNAKSSLVKYELATDGKLKEEAQWKLPAATGRPESYPCGIALNAAGTRALVCLSMNNSIAEIDLSTGKLLREIPVGVAPYAVLWHSDAMALVSCQGGNLPKKGAKTAPSAGTETEVDTRGVAAGGTVAFVDLKAGTTTSVAVGRQPTALLRWSDGKHLMVANSNDDSISLLSLTTKKEIAKLAVKPDDKLPFGSMPSAMAESSDGSTLYVTLAGNNAIALVRPFKPEPKPHGLIPTNWFPVAVHEVGGKLLIANGKGKGSLSAPRPTDKGKNSHDRTGSIQSIPLPDKDTLADFTKLALADSLVPEALRAQEWSTIAASTPPVPIPAKLGQPSTFRHVVYVIKENRTYDNIFGDIVGSEADPNLCIFPEEVTPNHHALAKEFVLLDNYYCNGVLSADGHSWATEGNVTPYLEKAFGGFTRSYTFGDDPLTYSSSGFIWDRFLEAGLSFRNFGEMDYAELPKGMTGRQLWDKYIAKERVEFSQNIGIENLRRYSSRSFPGWNMNIPDVLRVDRFLEEFREFERSGTLPNLTIVFLPQDHTGGAVTPRSNMADNDLALGRLVSAISKSRFWKETVIFVNEDDPQAGFDHIDGHRSICLIVSPYTKRGQIISNFYNQTSVIHTILRIFGLPPLGQRDAASPLMTACFTDKPNLAPYEVKPNRVPLDEFPKPSAELSGPAKYWAEVRDSLDTQEREIQTEREMDLLNRYLWHSMKGYARPYPVEWAGAHGRGLAKLGLAPDLTDRDDD